ncbi:MAG TPA: spore coat associated protein CotJA [Clostridia bacterium]|nr:spore coat associated protein CotJA [Clostridia bacterium]
MKEIKYDPEIQSADPVKIYPNRPAPPQMSMPGSPDRERPMFPPSTPLGMAYVPLQRWENVFSAEEGFEKGTMFADLYLPYLGEVVRRCTIGRVY